MNIMKEDIDNNYPISKSRRKVNNLSFVSAGTYIENNTTYYTYTNTSGQPLDITNFSVLFDTHICNYK